MQKYSTLCNPTIERRNSCKNMVGEMLKICDENKYIQRNCAGKVFSSTIDIDTLKNYADNKKRVFVDTTLPLHMLCFLIILSKM